MCHAAHSSLLTAPPRPVTSPAVKKYAKAVRHQRRFAKQAEKEKQEAAIGELCDGDAIDSDATVGYEAGDDGDEFENPIDLRGDDSDSDASAPGAGSDDDIYGGAADDGAPPMPPMPTRAAANRDAH